MASGMSFTFKTQNLDILKKAMERAVASVFIGHKAGPQAEKAEKNHFGGIGGSWIGTYDGKPHFVAVIRARPYLDDTFYWNKPSIEDGSKQFFKNAIQGKSTQSDLSMIGNELVINTRNMVYDGLYEASIPNPQNVIEGKGPGKPPLVDNGDMMSSLTYEASK
jgi:hypothetical protein